LECEVFATGGTDFFSSSSEISGKSSTGTVQFHRYRRMTLERSPCDSDNSPLAVNGSDFSLDAKIMYIQWIILRVEESDTREPQSRPPKRPFAAKPSSIMSSTLGSSNLARLSTVGNVMSGKASRMVGGPPRSPFEVNSSPPAGDDTFGKVGCELPRRPLVIMSRIDTRPDF
jgi:hypothetical protein